MKNYMIQPYLNACIISDINDQWCNNRINKCLILSNINGDEFIQYVLTVGIVDSVAECENDIGHWITATREVIEKFILIGETGKAFVNMDDFFCIGAVV